TNVTISANIAGGFGGGIANLAGGVAVLNTVTMNGNSSSDTVQGSTGSGIYNDPSDSVTINGVIIASNTSGSNCAGLITSQGDNISSDASCNLTGPGDRNSTDPLLGPLQDNGGFMPTHALLPGSPAIDGVTHNACPPPATDQRGFLRPAGARCDVGAFELGAALPTPTAT